MGSLRILIAVASLQWQRWCWEKTLKYAYLRERRQRPSLLDSGHLTRFTMVFIVSPLVLVSNAGKISIFYTTQFYKKYGKWEIKGFHLCLLFSISLFYLISQYHVVIFHTWFQIHKKIYNVFCTRLLYHGQTNTKMLKEARPWALWNANFICNNQIRISKVHALELSTGSYCPIRFQWIMDHIHDGSSLYISRLLLPIASFAHGPY